MRKLSLQVRSVQQDILSGTYGFPHQPFNGISQSISSFGLLSEASYNKAYLFCSSRGRGKIGLGGHLGKLVQEGKRIGIVQAVPRPIWIWDLLNKRFEEKEHAWVFAALNATRFLLAQFKIFCRSCNKKLDIDLRFRSRCIICGYVEYWSVVCRVQ